MKSEQFPAVGGGEGKLLSRGGETFPQVRLIYSLSSVYLYDLYHLGSPLQY